MADYYVSLPAWTALPTWAANTAYTVGQIIRSPSAQTFSVAQHCTTAGTSGAIEPTWTYDNDGTTTDGTAVFTANSGLSVDGWNAPCGDLTTLNYVANVNAGDRVFLSSDHTDSKGTYAFGSNGFGLIQIVSVNRAGAVPPGPADAKSGAVLSPASATFNLVLDAYRNLYWEGITFNGGASGSGSIYLNSGGNLGHYFKNCAFVINSTNASATIRPNDPVVATFDNTTMQFASSAQGIIGTTIVYEVTWINTPAAFVGPNIPAVLFQRPTEDYVWTFRGVDLSAITGKLYQSSNTIYTAVKLLFDNCLLNPALTPLDTSAGVPVNRDIIEFVNCYNGTTTISERHTAAGDLTTDRSTTLVNGASDDAGLYSFKVVSSVRADQFTFPMETFWFDVENTAVGASHTATVEIIGSTPLNNTDIHLMLEYLGTSGSTLAKFTSSLASSLSAPTLLPSSTSTWNNPPVTPSAQLLEATFTPQTVGRLRGYVRLGKISTTVWVNPVITVT